MRNYESLIEQLVQETEKNREKEKAVFLARTKQRAAMAEKRTEQGIRMLKEMGLKTESLVKMLNAAKSHKKKRLEALTQKYTTYRAEPKRIPASDYLAAAIKAATMPPGTRALPVYSVRCPSTEDPPNEAGEGVRSILKSVVRNFTTFDCALLAVGDAEFSSGPFYFYYVYRPLVSQHYNVRFFWSFRGFYRLFTSGGPECNVLSFLGISRPRARIKIALKVEAWQVRGTASSEQWIKCGEYDCPVWDDEVNWCNVDYNERFDVDRFCDRSFFLTGMMTVFVCTITFTVHSEGEGSEAEVDFATGDNNFFRCPEVFVDDPIRINPRHVPDPIAGFTFDP